MRLLTHRLEVCSVAIFEQAFIVYVFGERMVNQTPIFLSGQVCAVDTRSRCYFEST